MLIYNTTYHCDKSCYERFAAWLRTYYIPQVLKHQGVSQPRLARILGQDDNEGISISLQFTTTDFDTLSTWYERCGASLVEQLEKDFKQEVVGFSTIMESIDL